MNVTLPWPDRRLSPNARVHHMARAKVAAAARDDALIATSGQLSVQQRRDMAQGDGPIHLAITFRPPDKRRRDLDNMLGAAKSALDGFAYACQIDDVRFELSLRRAEPVKGGAIEVFIPTIHATAPQTEGGSACWCGGRKVEIERPATSLPTTRGADHHAKGPRYGS